jgi:hypothetical protein
MHTIIVDHVTVTGKLPAQAAKLEFQEDLLFM